MACKCIWSHVQCDTIHNILHSSALTFYIHLSEIESSCMSCGKEIVLWKMEGQSHKPESLPITYDIDTHMQNDGLDTTLSRSSLRTMGLSPPESSFPNHTSLHLRRVLVTSPTLKHGRQPCQRDHLMHTCIINNWVMPILNCLPCLPMAARWTPSFLICQGYYCLGSPILNSWVL